ncbi:MAG TPA: ATP-binding protein, partial [Methanobacterium sp.]
NDELQRFAYVVSHDFKEPLRMVSSFTQLIQSRYLGKLDKEADEFIDFIVEGSRRMEILLDDLLSYSRITSAEGKYKEINLNSIIEECMFNLKLAIEENNAEITWDHLPTVFVNKTQMIHVFQNLIANAIKFRSSDTPKIHISAQIEENQLILSVSDNGIGIDLQYSERIFEVFQRLHRRDEYEGTGMGLFLTKKILERHNGHIWVESESGNGSTFYFTLPIENPVAY